MTRANHAAGSALSCKRPFETPIATSQAEIADANSASSFSPIALDAASESDSGSEDSQINTHVSSKSMNHRHSSGQSPRFAQAYLERTRTDTPRQAAGGSYE